MKILKYIAVIAASILACSTYAADNASAKAPVQVQVGTEKGNIVMNITINPTDKISSEEALRQALLAALSHTDPNSVNGRAISASMLAIKASLGDGYEPVTTQIKVFVTIANAVVDNNNVATVKATVQMNGATYEANTETTLNPETQVAQTSGNVSSNVDGKSSSAPVAVAIDSKGELVGSIGNAGVTAQAPTTVAPTPVVTPTSVQEAEANAGNETTPDNTVVSSATK